MASSADATSKRAGGGNRAGPVAGSSIPGLLGLVAGVATAAFAASQVPSKFGVLAVLLVTPCFALALGAINGALIVEGGLQPFIATLAMMVSALGIGRLTGGQDFAVIPVYTGTNATETFEALRSMVWGVLPAPSLFFLVAILFFGAVLRFTTFGRYVYAIGGNVEAAKLSGVKVKQVQLPPMSFPDVAGLAGVLSSPSIGKASRTPARASNSTRSPPSSSADSLMGGQGGLAGTFVGVLIFGLLSDILQLQNINSNVQLLMKGLIIVGTVLVQEQNLGQLLGGGGASARASANTAGSAETLGRQTQQQRQS